MAEGNHIITSSIEHPAVSEVCHFLESRFNFKVTYLPVDEKGRVSVIDVERAITKDTILISIMHSNNEVGTIQPIKEIAQIAKKHNITFHTDASQSIGKVRVKVDELGVDLLTIAGHKLYAPKGIGALYVRSGVTMEKFMHGAGHEMGKRAGTENILEIVGLGKACEVVGTDLNKSSTRLKSLRDLLLHGLKEKFPNMRVNGDLDNCLPNTLSVSFPNLKSNQIMAKLDPFLCVSPGAACHSDVLSVSHVLKAMKVPQEYALGTLRLSTGRLSTEEDIHKAIDILSTEISQLYQSVVTS